MRLATAKQMQNLDAAAINVFGIPGIVLMENAGRGTVEFMVKRFGNLMGKKIAIFVGPGNNGGDGLVIARHIHQSGGLPTVYLLVEPEKLKGDAATNLAIVQRLPVPLIPILEDEALKKAEADITTAFLLVDAVFGTGLKREVLGFFGAVVQAINQCPRPVIAVDIPSGLDADTGQPLGECIKADATVTFGLAKPGQIIQPGAIFVGDLEIIDIGIPVETEAEVNLNLTCLDKREIDGLLPVRQSDSHKGTHGHLLVLAGSTGKSGAAILTAQGALRSGVGLVTLGVPVDLNVIFETALAEAMTAPLPGSENGFLSVASLNDIHELLEGKKGIALGPGLGTAPETVDLVASLYREIELPMVIDADGLNILAGHSSIIRQSAGPRILTPHPGEMARLLETSTKMVQADRVTIARDFACRHNVVLVLKGAATVVAAPDGRIAINPSGNAGMATGGMGDVLTGLIGGLLAQKIGAWEAACVGVYVHGLAGDKIRTSGEGDSGFLASELAAEIPAVVAEVRRLKAERTNKAYKEKTCCKPKI